MKTFKILAGECLLTIMDGVVMGLELIADIACTLSWKVESTEYRIDRWINNL